MKILICAAYYYPHIGGYEKNIAELVKRLLLKGYEIDILTCNTNECSLIESSGVKSRIYRLPCWNLLGKTYPVHKLSSSTFIVLDHLKRNNYDVVITQTRFFATSLLGYLFAKKQHIPLIHVERGTCHSIVNNPIVRIFAQVYDHLVASRIVKNSVYNIGISDAACRFINHIGGKNTRTIYNGIDVPQIPRYRSDDGYKIISFVGRLIYGKGVQDLIIAFKNLKMNNKVVLKIVGKGNYEKELRKLAKGDPFILFLGEYNRQQVNALLAQTDIFVNPSYSEGLPTSVIEAGAMGVPIVATDVGGTNEVINKMWLIQPHKPEQIEYAVETLLRYRSVAETNAKIVYNTVKSKFNWDDITNQWDKLLQEVNN